MLQSNLCNKSVTSCLWDTLAHHSYSGYKATGVRCNILLIGRCYGGRGSYSSFWHGVIQGIACDYVPFGVDRQACQGQLGKKIRSSFTGVVCVDQW